MSAKPSKKSAKNPVRPAPGPAAPLAPTPVAAGGAVAATATTGTFTPWIDSADPKKRMIGKVALIGLWIYVAALWLLALDQTFDWGIFGPKIPPTS